VSAAATTPLRDGADEGESDAEFVAEPAAHSVSKAADSCRSFEAVYDAWFHEISRWVRAFGGLDADLDDLVQEVFLVVRRKFGNFDGKNLPGWLYRITQRTVSDYRRRAWFRRFFQAKRQMLEQVVDPAPDPESHANTRDAQRIMVRLLSKMSPTRRAAFILFEIEGYSGEEIAALEGIPVKTVYSRLHYARKDFYRLVSEFVASEEGSRS
jgi:RNA polymerase sigma-70 factor (ECF subfamily)